MKTRKNAGGDASRGELRRRWRAIMEDGLFSKVGAQGRLVALYVFLKADWSSCQIRFSARQASRDLSVAISTVHRGLAELVSEGILTLDRGGGAGKRAVYEVSNRSHVGNSASHTQERLRSIRGNGLSRPMGRTVPTYGKNRSHVREEPFPLGEQTAVFLSGSQLRTSERTSTADAGAGLRPARRRRPSRLIEEVPPPSAAEVDQSGILKEEVNE